MRLQHELILPQARYLGHKTRPTKDEPIVHIAFRTALTQEVAEAFGCRELVYAGNVPRSGVATMVPEGVETDCEIHVKHDAVAFQTVAKELGHYTVKFQGTGPELLFVVKVEGLSDEASLLAKLVKIDPLAITLKPNQMDLGLEESKPEDAGEGTGEPDDSERLISKEQAEDTKGADEDGPLPSVVEMGGSHQKGTRKQRGRRGGEPEPAAGESDPGDVIEQLVN